MTNIVYVYTASNFSCILTGAFNFMRLEQSHVINVLISIAFDIIALSVCTEFSSCLNLFLMNISSTTVITSSLSICNKQVNLFEANMLTYIALLLGDCIGLIA